ncbi:MAG TPA: RNA 2',3'-cyclic phosphodiesterase [Pyrinomonadaceae bacterium]|nr:RNA 2',3'-cyclic phosphodiesterase [Pyrinomonadaceae bacterium]
MSDQKRIFVAIDISDEARSQIADYSEGLRKRFPAARCSWVRPENLHITLRFIGNVDDEGLAAWSQKVAAAAASIAPFSLVIEGTGKFSQRRQRTDVLWIGSRAETADRLTQIARDLNDGKAIKPHVTIGRFKDSPDASQLAAEHCAASFVPLAFDVTELVVYESRLTPNGSIYTQIFRAPLSAITSSTPADRPAATGGRPSRPSR